MSVLQTNRAVCENVGPEKVHRALAEVASKLDPVGDNQLLVDRAHEIGLQHDWDGTIEVPDGLLLHGERIDAIVDLHAALDEDQAFEQRHIDRATYEAGKRISAEAADVEAGEDAAEPAGIGTMSTVFNYGWATVAATGFDQGAWAFNPGIHNRSRRIRKHGVRGGTGRLNRGGRVYYEFGGAGHNTRYWSNWRLESGFSRISFAAFSTDIYTVSAQVGYGW